ncbi:Vgr family protein [Tenacibaculum finnmarkense]|uniref:type VI secretion system Vgr family protein n=1 Tax=Tenacibaculum finnmarkense TaxID=2781243 RepID=UPI00187B8E07|nr:phage baseplate assembly protein V [Tenacibaculum finnmarkense]MBE7649222.1 Vgr family protein [Tenacibaculum finnmarkense genomovar ulcerans]MCD8455089.1 phage baseplate assembly protein V [Tenacibaculum finnmarkense genomovar ulcerans]MCG8806440.1 Vgr family protein [Tenacibaculum finnmarkense]MCG8857530.1 Vgr family protein [Tenacibaculum finnmarkense]WCC41208.1 phage baseplate assembly protein V [Tenacibaculum finnmarkense]
MIPLTTLNIDGRSFLSFEKITLEQAINNHHSFTIIVDYDSIETVNSYTLDNSKEWLGKSVVINFDDTDFLGVITHVKLQHNDGFNGKLLVSGFSKTILLENGPHMHSWLNTSLETIVNDTVSAVGLSAQINTVFTSSIIYQSQYQENHFQFIQRLAKQYNEWLYYDGVQLVFGKPSLNTPITIEYGADMDTINISIEALSTGATKFSYNALEDTKNESISRGNVSGLNDLGDHAFETSKSLFVIDSKNHLSVRGANKNEIDTIVANEQASKVAAVNILSGTSTKQGLTVGTVIKVTGAQRGINSFDVKNYGEYIITKITHTATGSSEYCNEFEAISSGIEVLPAPKVTLPVASSQTATVISSNDPEKKGRIEVQFQWQTAEMKTSWIRVMSLNAGKSDTVTTNRGLIFVPEVGDTVMVGFRYNDPNRPYVLGALYNGKTGAGGDVDNKIKSITTRSGNTIVFDDEKGSIHIADANQNSISLDGEGNINISSSASIKLATGESSINLISDGTIAITGKVITINGADSINEISKAITHNGSDSVMLNSSKEISINANKEVTVTGLSKATITSSGTTAVEGTIIKLN